MAYQLNKDTKILLVLLVVVVLCSAKLFKDYLYRNRYIEGMTAVSQESSVQLRRPNSGATTADIIFTVSLGADLPTTGALSISWSGGAAVAGDVVFPTAGASYTAAASGYTIPSPSAAVSGTTATFGSPNKVVPRGTKVVVTVKGVNINNKVTSDVDKINFTIAAGSDTTSPSIVVSILPYVSTGQTAGASTYTASTSASVQEIQDAITGINTRLSVIGVNAPNDNEITNLTKARSALIALLASTYGTIKEAGQVFESGALYEAQKTAIDFITKEKARAASNADALTGDNLNKRRMAQINTYYTRNYEANTDVMKNVIYVSVALIILAVLRKKELIPGSISTLGVIFILTMGGIVIGKQIFDIMRRNDSDFDKYDWNFNEDQLNQQKLVQKNSDPASLSDMGIGGAPCYGASCCDVGTAWNDEMKKCIPSVNRISGTAAWSSGTLTVSLTVLTALAPTDTITITLPNGVFTGTPLLTGHAQLTASSLTTTSATLTVTTGASVSAAAKVNDIVITGMTIRDTATYLTKKLTVKTSKDVNEVGIDISGM
jgi:hypothetical protein